MSRSVTKPLVFALWLLCSVGLIFVAILRIQEQSEKTSLFAKSPTWGLSEPLIKTLSNEGVTQGSDSRFVSHLASSYAANNPLDPYAWLIKSRLEGETSEDLKAGYLQQSAKLAWNRHIPLRGVYIEQLLDGDIVEATVIAARLISLRPADAQTYFFDLHALLGSQVFYESLLLPAIQQNSDELKKDIMLSSFLDSAIQAQDDELVYKVWRLFATTLDVEDDRFKRYTDYLIDRQNWSQLQRVWQRASAQEITVSRIADPNFENVSEGGLCWRLTPVEGVNRTNNPNGIQLNFHGGQNLNYRQLSCVVGVNSSSRYQLDFDWSGNKISTQSGMFVEATTKIDGKQVNLGRSDARAGSWSLQSDQFEFTTPKGAQIISVTIRRAPTSNLDNKLSGKVYFTGFKLERLS